MAPHFVNFVPGNEMNSYPVSISIGCSVSYSIANGSLRWSRYSFCTGEGDETAEMADLEMHGVR